jgi:hypothetical protein
MKPSPPADASNDRETLHWSRLALLVWVLGALIRSFAQLVYWPSVLQFADAIRYARIGYWSGAFHDNWAPAGYAVFLRLLRFVSSSIGATIICQHALGLATAVLLTSAARRAGARTPWQLLPGAVVALVGDYTFLEHLLMPESLFLFLAGAGLFAAIRALEGDGRRWGVLSGVAFGLGALVRSNALPLLAFLALSVLPVPVSRRHAATSAMAWGVGCGAALVFVYAVVSAAVGPYTGLGNMTGWYLYGRTAPFADCTRMAVDDDSPDMAALCEATPPEKRYGPYYYTWEASGPGRTRWSAVTGPDPAYDRMVMRFAVDAIRRQPLDYLIAVLNDLVRIVAPGYRANPGNGQFMAAYSFGWRDDVTLENIQRALSQKYSGTEVRRNKGGVFLMTAYQEATRLPGAFLVIVGGCAAVGLLRSSGTRRGEVLLVLLSGLCLLLIPVLLVTWDFRYTLPATPVLALAAVIGFAPPSRKDADHPAFPRATGSGTGLVDRR